MSLSAPRSFGPAISASPHATGALDFFADGEIFDTPNAKPQSPFGFEPADDHGRTAIYG
jgi:hypothetical protein